MATRTMRIGRPMLAFILACLGFAAASLTGAGPGTPGSHAGDPELARILEAFDAAQMRAGSIVAEFTEEKKISLLTRPIVSRGLFYFRRPNQVRWEYSSPETKVYVITEDMYTAYLPSQKRAEQVPISRFVGKRLFRFIGVGQAIADLGAYYTFRLEPHAGLPDTHLLVLTPRKRRIQERISELRIWVDAMTFLPRQLQYVEIGGDTTTISFQKTRANAEIGSGSFQIRLPDDVTVSNSFDGFALAGQGY